MERALADSASAEMQQQKEVGIGVCWFSLRRVILLSRFDPNNKAMMLIIAFKHSAQL
jgi:hypothetical protein